ncbi:diguanylate cyclase (plasmid) [Lentzea sp. JNUCC 0626]|uniref:diguanylate cyclase n=1 Tax=Lentzea sp. JNUCC 0626 TaxID=3367513 RepID=UPI0037478D5C
MSVWTITGALAAGAATSGWIATACRLRGRTRERDDLAARLEREQCEADRLRFDRVTGQLARGAWEPEAQALLAEGHTVLGFVDLDEFKLLNDRLGHAAGDEVLRVVAQRLRRRLGEAGLVGRVGGDEVAFVAALAALPEMTGELDELVALLTEPVVLADGREVSVGVSLGLAWRADLPSAGVGLLSEAMAAADAAMYDAKAHGGGWRAYDPRVHPVRPARSIVPAPRQRLREHGPTALNSADREVCAP